MKRFLLAGVLSLIGVAPSLVTAQVTSINAVGYVNATVPTGFSLVANPLSGASNAARDVFASVPSGTELYRFVGTGFDKMTKLGDGLWQTSPSTGGAFFNDSSKEFSLVPGEGVFINNLSGSAFVNTFVGEVATGSLSNPVAAGFTIVSSQVPQQGLVQGLLQFPMQSNDVIYTLDSTGYTIYTLLAPNFWQKSPPSGAPVFGADQEPTIGVAQAFWSFKSASANWTRSFSVN